MQLERSERVGGGLRVYLVRHAKAERRIGWEAPDGLRPLAPRGLRQARALVPMLAEAGVTRIISSPHLRCTQTMEPVAAETGLPIELDERLAEGEGPGKALQLLDELGDAPVALCSHGDVLPGLIAELEERGVAIEIDGRFRSEKGSIWLVEGKRGRPRRASYHPCPDVGSDEEDAPERLAVLDLGSTSFRAVVFDVTSAGRLTHLESDRIMLRLGAAIALDGRISEATCGQAIESARRLGEFARGAGAQRLLPVATAALREADNGAALCARIAEALGDDVRTLSGEEEARLLLTAFRRRVVLPRETSLGIDLGGGSLELVAGSAEHLSWEATLPLGVTRLHRLLVKRDPMRKGDVRRVRERVAEALAPHRAALADVRKETCFAAGGTARAFARLAVAQRGLAAGPSSASIELPVVELAKLTRLLVRSDHAERLALTGIRKNRADLLPTGGLVLSGVAEALGIESFTVCDWGLREGVALEAVGAR